MKQRMRFVAFVKVFTISHAEVGSDKSRFFETNFNLDPLLKQNAYVPLPKVYK